MKKILFLFLVVSCAARGQELYRIAQYSSNATVFSPSLSAFSEGMQFTVLGRKQWSGISGSPVTGLFSASGNVGGSRIYLNGNLISDQVSVYNRTVANVGITYKLPINEENAVAVGLAGGFNADKVDLSRANYSPGDNALQFGIQDQVNAAIGASVSYGNSKYRLTASGGIQDALFKKNVFGYLNKVWTVNDVDFHGSVLYKYSAETYRDQLDLNTLVMYKRTIGAGIGYRLNNEMVFMARLNWKDKLQVGYAYDMSFGRLNGLNGHELFLRLQLPGRHSINLNRTGYTNPII